MSVALFLDKRTICAWWWDRNRFSARWVGDLAAAAFTRILAPGDWDLPLFWGTSMTCALAARFLRRSASGSVAGICSVGFERPKS